METKVTSEKSRFVAFLLCFFLGVLGAHRFYTGKIGTGILMLLTLGGFVVWMWVDLVLILLGLFHDKEGKLVYKWFESGSI